MGIEREGAEVNPYPYYKTPTNRREAQSNCNHWTWIALGGCPADEIPAAWNSYIRTFQRDANRTRNSFPIE